MSTDVKRVGIGKVEKYQLEVETNNSLEYIRKLTKSGGVTIPAPLRRLLGWEGKDTVSVEYNFELGEITIKRVKGKCPITGDTENLINFNGVYISDKIVSLIQKLGADVYDYSLLEDEVDLVISALQLKEKADKVALQNALKKLMKRNMKI